MTDLVAQVLAADVEGITLLGGEPFEQAPALAHFATSVRAYGLSVMTFTGYQMEQLKGADAPPGAAALLAATDLLVDGQYDAKRPDPGRPWVGSENQRFFMLTDRYRHIEPSLTEFQDRLEVRIQEDGSLTVNGWASGDQLDELLRGIAR